MIRGEFFRAIADVRRLGLSSELQRCLWGTRVRLILLVGATLLMISEPSLAWWNAESIMEGTESDDGGPGILVALLFIAIAIYVLVRLWDFMKSFFDKSK